MDKHIAAEQTCAYRSLYRASPNTQSSQRRLFFSPSKVGKKIGSCGVYPSFPAQGILPKMCVSWSPHLAQAPSSWAPGCRPSDLTGLSANRMPQNSQGSSSSSLSIWPFGVNPIFRHTLYIMVSYIPMISWFLEIYPHDTKWSSWLVTKSPWMWEKTKSYTIWEWEMITQKNGDLGNGLRHGPPRTTELRLAKSPLAAAMGSRSSRALETNFDTSTKLRWRSWGFPKKGAPNSWIAGWFNHRKRDLKKKNGW